MDVPLCFLDDKANLRITQSKINVAKIVAPIAIYKTILLRDLIKFNMEAEDPQIAITIIKYMPILAFPPSRLFFKTPKKYNTPTTTVAAENARLNSIFIINLSNNCTPVISSNLGTINPTIVVITIAWRDFETFLI